MTKKTKSIFLDDLKQLGHIRISEELLKEMINFETNRQLNQFSNIYFNKVKINYSIDEI